MSTRLLSRRLWWFSLFLILTLGMAFYLTLVRVTKSTITNQFLKRQQTLGRAQAVNIVSFFQVMGDSVATLSQLSSLELRDASTLRDMEAFVEQRSGSGLVGGLILTNGQGLVQFNPNILDRPDLGASVADRDYFVWAREQSGQGGYFISEPVISKLGASQGEVVVVVASPVFQNGVFGGVVATSVLLHPLTESFLGFFEISELTEVYLTKIDGELLYVKSDPGMVGSSIFDILGEGLKETLGKEETGKFEKGGRLVSYAQIDLGSQHWYLVMTSPATQILEDAQPLYIRQLAILLLVSLSFLLYGIIVARERHSGKRSQKTL